MPDVIEPSRHPLRAAIYARVSAEDERDILANQVTRLREYCADRGFDLPDANIFVEVASGTLKTQSRLNDLIEQSNRVPRPFRIVVFSALSRMTREGIEGALYVLHRLELVNVGWHFVEQPILNYDDSSPELSRKIMLAVLSELDRDYRRRISAATRAAYLRRKALATARGDTIRWGRPKGSKTRKRGPPATLTSGAETELGAIS